jgi:hypothetical protein
VGPARYRKLPNRYHGRTRQGKTEATEAETLRGFRRSCHPLTSRFYCFGYRRSWVQIPPPRPGIPRCGLDIVKVGNFPASRVRNLGSLWEATLAKSTGAWPSHHSLRAPVASRRSLIAPSVTDGRDQSQSRPSMVGPARLTVTAVIRTGRPIPDVVIPFVRSLERSAALRDGSKATAGRSPRPHVPPSAQRPPRQPPR